MALSMDPHLVWWNLPMVSLTAATLGQLDQGPGCGFANLAEVGAPVFGRQLLPEG